MSNNIKNFSFKLCCLIIIFIFTQTLSFTQNVTRFTDRAQKAADNASNQEGSLNSPTPQNSVPPNTLSNSTVVHTTFLFDDDTKVSANTTEIRAIWITRGDYKNANDIKMIAENCAKYHFNMLIFQVRGNGTVYYKSKIEPWAWELTSSSVSTLGKDPSWDPLQVAVDEAHKNGLQLIAWLNTMPGWKGEEPPPSNVKQLWNTHPDWFMRDSTGAMMLPKGKNQGWYRFISPTIPEVQDYIRDLYVEVVKNYNVDGIHFDYIRYPGEIGEFSYDSISLDLFKKKYGVPWTQRKEDWAQFRRDGVAAVVTKTYQAVTAINPNIEVTAAVIDNANSARNVHYTSARQWFSSGVMDITMPMSYTGDTIKFRKVNEDHIQNAYGRFVCPGIAIGDKFANTPQLMNDEIQIARDLGANGVTFFAYQGLFPHNQPNELADDLLKGPFSKPSVIPTLYWK